MSEVRRFNFDPKRESIAARKRAYANLQENPFKTLEPEAWRVDLLQNRVNISSIIDEHGQVKIGEDARTHGQMTLGEYVKNFLDNPVEPLQKEGRDDFYQVIYKRGTQRWGALFARAAVKSLKEHFVAYTGPHHALSPVALQGAINMSLAYMQERERKGNKGPRGVILTLGSEATPLSNPLTRRGPEKAREQVTIKNSQGSTMKERDRLATIVTPLFSDNEREILVAAAPPVTKETINAAIAREVKALERFGSDQRKRKEELAEVLQAKQKLEDGTFHTWIEAMFEREFTIALQLAQTPGILPGIELAMYNTILEKRNRRLELLKPKQTQYPARITEINSLSDINRPSVEETLATIDTFKTIYKNRKVLKEPTYSRQLERTIVAEWEKIKTPEMPDMMWLALEGVVGDLVEKDLGTTSFFSQILLNPTLRRAVIEEMGEGVVPLTANPETETTKIQGAWDKDRLEFAPYMDMSDEQRSKYVEGAGTMFFWGIDKNKKSVPLVVFEGNNGTAYLQRADRSFRDKSFRIPLTAEHVKQALAEGKIIPSVATDFMVLAFARGLKCYGGSNQIDYLPQMQEAMIKALQVAIESTEDQALQAQYKQWQESIAEVLTRNYILRIGGMVAMYENGFSGLAGPLEIMAKGGLKPEQLEALKNLSLKDAILTGFPLSPSEKGALLQAYSADMPIFPFSNENFFFGPQFMKVLREIGALDEWPEYEKDTLAFEEIKRIQEEKIKMQEWIIFEGEKHEQSLREQKEREEERILAKAKREAQLSTIIENLRERRQQTQPGTARIQRVPRKRR